MLDNLNILNLASAMARHAAARHQVISENIANADTSNYRAKDLEPFSEAYSRMAKQFNQTGDRSPFSGSEPPWRVNLIETPGMESPNGNNVSLEDQMMRSIETQGDHETATLIYKKSIDILRLAVRGRA
jgi:flagellar basal-body rod protein FlgB